MARNETTHDIALLIQLTSIRKAIHLLACYVSAMVFCFLAARWWPDAPMVAAIAIFASAAISYGWDHQAERLLQKSYGKAANVEDE
jgi:hypothetical protein